MADEVSLSLRFLSSLAKMGIREITAEKAWSSLRASYSQENRVYHNLAHVAAMLQWLDEIGNADPAIELAIWYHDVVYDPRAADNEKQSADFFRHELGSDLPVEFVDQVCALILATDHRFPSSGNEDESLIRDIDLSILAAERDIYQKYALAIRQEYSHVPDAAYREGRGKVLKKFLERRIFLSDRFSEMENDARGNIEAELNMLVTD